MFTFTRLRAKCSPPRKKHLTICRGVVFGRTLLRLPHLRVSYHVDEAAGPDYLSTERFVHVWLFRFVLVIGRRSKR